MVRVLGAPSSAPFLLVLCFSSERQTLSVLADLATTNQPKELGHEFAPITRTTIIYSCCPWHLLGLRSTTMHAVAIHLIQVAYHKAAADIEGLPIHSFPRPLPATKRLFPPPSQGTERRADQKDTCALVHVRALRF